MRFLKLYDYEINDVVKSEETILHNLKKENIESNFIVADFHWACSINSRGIKITQGIVNNFRSKLKGPSKLIFICQHISVKSIDWGDSIVFTPHATIQDKFIPIPHYSCVYSKERKQQNITVSFIGAFETHYSRRIISELFKNKNKCVVEDTGQWHFYNKDKKAEREENYIDILSRSKIVLCPRGTGPGSIRLWEVLSSGGIPIVISDNLQLPDIYNGIILVVQNKFVHILDNIVENYITNTDLEALRDRIKNIHNLYTNNCNLHKLVVEYIKKER